MRLAKYYFIILSTMNKYLQIKLGYNIKFVVITGKIKITNSIFTLVDNKKI